MINFNLVLVALMVVMVIMTGFWFIELKRNNASYIDIGWVIGIALTTVLLAIGHQGLFERKLFLVLMVVCWAIRLGFYLIRRVTTDPHEDKRYLYLRQQWGKEAHRNYFVLFQFQALLAVALSLGLLSGLIDQNPTWYMTQTIGISIWIIGFCGESLADHQLKSFKLDPGNKGKTCASGLWNYSRHPNYFFEWVMWIGYAVYVWSSPWGWTGISSAALMLFFLVKLTGIPFSEQMALQTRGENYRRYQAQTSMFIPWFKKDSIN